LIKLHGLRRPRRFSSGAGEIENGDPQKNHPQNSESWHSARAIDDRISEEEDSRNYKDSGDYGITRDPKRWIVSTPAAKNENGRDRKRVERHNCGHESVGELLKGPEQHENDAEGSREANRDGARLKTRMDESDTFEYQPLRRPHS
jgi:hypothetical protein